MTLNDITWPLVTGKDPEVTSFYRKLPAGGCRGPKSCIICAFDFLQGCCSQEEVTWHEMTSRDLKCPEVTRKSRHLTGSHPEMVVMGWKLGSLVRLTSYKAVARRRQSHDRKWHHVTSGDQEWTGRKSFDRKSPSGGCKRRKVASGSFDFLQGCNSQ